MARTPSAIILDAYRALRIPADPNRDNAITYRALVEIFLSNGYGINKATKRIQDMIAWELLIDTPEGLILSEQLKIKL